MAAARDVLIGFVTTNDPVSRRGPASIITAVKAKQPQVIYLLYTVSTRTNRNMLIARIRKDPEFKDAEIPHLEPLGLSDVTNYDVLAGVLIEVLTRIGVRHPGAQFHLVSGLPQARLVFALCLFAQVLPGILWEVNEPRRSLSAKARAASALDRKACEERLEQWPTTIFNRFRDVLLRRRLNARLVFNIDNKRVSLDGLSLGLRSRAHGIHHRSFALLVLLAARKVYGAGQDTLDKELLEKTVYEHVSAPEKQIPEAVSRLNEKVRGISRRGRGPLDVLIERQNGAYRLTDELNTGYLTIVFEDLEGLRNYLKGILGKASLLGSLFPELP